MARTSRPTQGISSSRADTSQNQHAPSNIAESSSSRITPDRSHLGRSCGRGGGSKRVAMGSAAIPKRPDTASPAPRSHAASAPARPLPARRGSSPLKRAVPSAQSDYTSRTTAISRSNLHQSKVAETVSRSFSRAAGSSAKPIIVSSSDERGARDDDNVSHSDSSSDTSSHYASAASSIVSDDSRPDSPTPPPVSSFRDRDERDRIMAARVIAETGGLPHRSGPSRIIAATSPSTMTNSSDEDLSPIPLLSDPEHPPIIIQPNPTIGFTFSNSTPEYIPQPLVELPSPEVPVDDDSRVPVKKIIIASDISDDGDPRWIDGQDDDFEMIEVRRTVSGSILPDMVGLHSPQVAPAIADESVSRSPTPPLDIDEESPPKEAAELDPASALTWLSPETQSFSFGTPKRAMMSRSRNLAKSTTKVVWKTQTPVSDDRRSLFPYATTPPAQSNLTKRDLASPSAAERPAKRSLSSRISSSSVVQETSIAKSLDEDASMATSGEGYHSAHAVMSRTSIHPLTNVAQWKSTKPTGILMSNSPYLSRESILQQSDAERSESRTPFETRRHMNGEQGIMKEHFVGEEASNSQAASGAKPLLARMAFPPGHPLATANLSGHLSSITTPNSSQPVLPKASAVEVAIQTDALPADDPPAPNPVEWSLIQHHGATLDVGSRVLDLLLYEVSLSASRCLDGTHVIFAHGLMPFKARFKDLVYDLGGEVLEMDAEELFEPRNESISRYLVTPTTHVVEYEIYDLYVDVQQFDVIVLFDLIMSAREAEYSAKKQSEEAARLENEERLVEERLMQEQEDAERRSLVTRIHGGKSSKTTLTTVDNAFSEIGVKPAEKNGQGSGFIARLDRPSNLPAKPSAGGRMMQRISDTSSISENAVNQRPAIAQGSGNAAVALGNGRAARPLAERLG